MRRLLLHPLLLAFALAAGAPAFAQDAATGFDPRTGDAWVDTWLDDINRYGRAYREPFVDELVRYHGAPRELVVELLGRPGWAPGDVYYACRLASVLGRPCRYVADEYARDREAGWGALAQRLGVKPGSAEFQRLKRGFVPTYDRWSRPIQLDADLERAYPGRARGKARPDRGASGPGKEPTAVDGPSKPEPPRGGPNQPRAKGSNEGGGKAGQAGKEHDAHDAGTPKDAGKEKGAKGNKAGKG